MMRLRRIHKDDLENIFIIRNIQGIYSQCRQYAPLHWESHLEWYDWQRKDPNTEMFVFEDMVSTYSEKPVLVGVCGLTSIDWINRRAEFSCYINPTFHKKGYGTAALEELFDFGFYSLNLNSIWGETFEGNPAYHVFTKKLDMTVEGTRRQFYYKDGKYIDAHLLSITRSEWEARS